MRSPRSLSVGFIQIVLTGIYASAGCYRDRPVTVGAFVPVKHGQIESLVEEMCEQVNGLTHDPFYAASYLLWRVNWIHPFQEGNGRTARELCLLALEVGMPRENAVVWDVMSGFMAINRDRYFERLSRADKLCSDQAENCAEPVEGFLMDLYLAAVEYSATQ